MIISKYKTSVSSDNDAKQMMLLLEPFFLESIISFDLKHPDKILTIESHYEEYHPEIVIDIMSMRNHTCIDISDHPENIK
jgi:hypothetical protein